MPELRPAGERLCREGDHRYSSDDDESDPQPKVYALILDETGGDALVDDVALLKEELPGRHGRPDNRDDEQDDFIQFPALGHLGNEEVSRHLADRRMNDDEHRHQEEAGEYQ